MRLLFLGTHSHGGFGLVTDELTRRFLRLGLDVRVLAVDHRGEPIRGDLAGRIWPASLLGGSHGERTGDAITGKFWRFMDHADGWLPDVVLAIDDMSGFLGRMGGTVAQEWLTLPVFHYDPIEGDNLQPLWRDVWSLFRPVAMSRYGQQVIEGLTGKPVPMIYHGVDTDAFHPVSMNDPVIWDGKRLQTKEACKRAFDQDPERKLILRSDALVERKFYDRFVAAIMPILDADPEVDVLLHTTPIRDGLDLIQELKRMPERFVGRVRLTGMHDTWVGLPTEGLVALINAADLYVSTTGGEGFGLNLAEALACEVPVVCSDWAASAEVVGPGGVMVPPLLDRYGDVVRYHSHYGMDWAVPDPRAFIEPILYLLSHPAKRRALGSEGRAHVKRSFNWDTAAAQFVALFEEARATPADPL